MAIAVFNSSTFLLRYPEFNTLPEPLLQSYFDEAGVYLNNTDCSLVTNVTTRGVYLNMLTAHIAALYGGTNGNAPSGIVGRINSATEGSVSVGADMSGQPGSAAWYQQTPYGAAYWQVTAQYRTARPVLGISYPPTYAFGPAWGLVGRVPPWPR